MKAWYWVAGGVAAAAGAVAIALGIRGTGLIQEAIYTTGLDTRSPQDILDAVEQIDPESATTAPDLQPGYGGAGYTWCNKFMADVTAKLGAPLPFGANGTLVNDQIAWIDAGNDGWFPVSGSAEAQQRALQGQVVVATYYSLVPPPDNHGHMALVLPIDGPIQIAQAGQHNYNQAPLNYGFGAIQPVYYAHA